MANLRLIEIKVIDSTTINARFTDALDILINSVNINIIANTPGIPNPKVLIVDIENDTLIVTTQPMTPYGTYFVTFKSTDLFKFKSKDGASFLFEDGKTNSVLILGPEDPADPIRDSLLVYLKDNVYNLDPGTLVRDNINNQSKNISRGLYDIRQAKSDNYLGFTVLDENKIRGSGPFDRLSEEGAYKVIRVGKNKSGSTTTISISFDSFPSGPITLLANSIIGEQLIAGEGSSTFNGLVLTTSNRFVTKLKKVLIAYQNSTTAIYDLNIFGYQILEPRYDRDIASPLFSLEDNQFKLSDSILDSSFVLPTAGDVVFVDYEYELKGRVIDESTVIVSQVLNAVREITPPILTAFTLGHAPIVSAIDVVIISDGVEFLDPNSNPPFSMTHPAFTREIPFKFDGLPSRVGEFSIDYITGRVFCFGAITNDGTGDFPPVANYQYRNLFNSRLDYTYDSDTSELVANPLRSLIEQSAKITFSYELVLVPGIDYIPQIHTEVLNERIENRLISTNSLRVSYPPVTNVFRIYNETSGEIYKIQRWNDSSVYFTTSTPPNIQDKIGERVSFSNVIDELLIVNNEVVNTISTRVFIVNLQNNRIISASEDTIGASFDSSAVFSRSDIFQNEIYYDNQLSYIVNTDRLTVGQYQIDYQNGLLYIGISHAQDFDLGTINYKKSTISPLNSHVISVSELYNSISNIFGINKRISYTSIGEGFVQPASFDVADERFLNGDNSYPYIVDSNAITVTDDIKDIRNIFDVYDLNHNEYPTNFSDGATISANIISLNPDGIQKQEILNVQSGNIINVTNFTPGAEICGVFSVIRISDNVDLWQASPGVFINYAITLSGVNSPVVGDSVLVIYQVKLNGAATPIVDYSRGDYLMDYSYLADEILVSYEYGDNNLDFRQSSALNVNDEYFVTYKAGALRQALLQNFGTLVDIPILNTLDTTFPRENYRDALKAALQSFPLGPTIPAMKAIVSNISHIDPELIEAAFQNWSLGLSHLYLSNIKSTGDIQLVTGKHDLGALVEENNQTITFPVSSNLRLEEGTLETWVIPEWDGLDNDATLTFNLILNGNVLPASKVFIGADSHNPTYDENNNFKINRTDLISPIGLPSSLYTHTGMFIYYDDIAKRWKVYAKEILNTVDGYVFSGTIQSSGECYDVKFIPGLGEINDILRSGIDKIEFKFNIDSYDLISPDGYVDGYSKLDGYYPGDGYVAGYSFDGIDFMADDEHYIFDFGKDQLTDRFSLYKDGKGYLNFRVFDKSVQRKNQYKISADISNWLAGQKHFIAISWRLNSLDKKDEMHLFIDGIEVPNIMKYGGRPLGTSTDRFRTIKPEYVAGIITKPIIAGNDLITNIGSAVVVSDSINFQSDGIMVGDIITINESGFGSYIITGISNNSLTLNTTVSTELTNARFSVNEYLTVVSSEIDLYNNISVSMIKGSIETEIGGSRAVIPEYSISKNALNQNVLTILGSANVGDQIVIRTLGLNHRRAKDRQFVWGNTSSILKTQLPSPINLDSVLITAVLLPLVTIGPNNSILILNKFNATLFPTQPTNTIEGRSLSIRITGGNVDFSTTVTVTINGSTTVGPTTEIITFTAAGSKTTTKKFTIITSAIVVAKPLVNTKDCVSIEIKEANPITVSEGNNIYPVIRFSYKTQIGSKLEGNINTNIVTDNSGFFAASNVNQNLIISSPPTVAGTYTILSRIDDNNITITPILPASFINGTYNIFNVALTRSGFQNGFFTLEQAGEVNVPFTLSQGVYEFDYASYLEIPFDPVSNLTAYVGSDMNGEKQAKAVLDEFRILSNKLTDVRIGEVIASNQHSITTDFTRLHKFKPDSNTLMLLDFDSMPLVNMADFWITSEKEFLQSGNSVNSNFGQSLVITNRPLVIDNSGLLDTTSEGSIEFWVSPRFDTYNDPNIRMYFDASGTVVEEVTSVSNGVVKVAGNISSVLNVSLASDSTHADFFQNGSIASDFQTILLQKALPYQQTPVKVNYIPSGLSGDRISIYKDKEGFIVFNVSAQGLDYQVRQPIFWSKNSWHRVMVTYKFNRVDNLDELRLFVDGEERGVITFGKDLIFGSNLIFGQGFSGVSNAHLISDINFSDPINQFFIGSDFYKTNFAEARIDNFRLSNISRNPISVAGQPKDINYSSNLNIVYPVVEDAFTTYLLNFDSMIMKTDDLALLKNKQFGIFDFTLNIIDSFGIISGNAKIKQVLENLIMALKPAPSKVRINYL